MSVADDLMLLAASRQPRSVAFLCVSEAANVLVDAMFSDGVTIWLVDGRGQGTLDGRTRLPLASGAARVCTMAPAAGSATPAQSRCGNFEALIDAELPTCANAAPGAGADCANYQPVGVVRVLFADGALGRGAGFATRIEEVVATAKSAIEAVHSALEVCRSCAKLDAPIAIENHSLDLAVSLFAPSWFYESPYGAFAECLVRRFDPLWPQGRPAPQLATLLDELHRTLFELQLEAHVQELERLVDGEHGRIYLAARPFIETEAGCAIHPAMPVLLESLASHFVVDDLALGVERMIWEERGDTPAFVQAFVLRPAPQTRSDRPPRRAAVPPPRRAR